MPTLLEKFRSQYPDGCLSADLVSMHDGQYVVRAAVALQGKTLATGLSASTDVQIAEDRARERAIAGLGILADQVQLPEAASEVTYSQNKPDAVGTVSSPTPFQTPAEIPALPVVPLDEPIGDFGPSIDEIADEPAIAAKPSAATKALESFNTSAHPVDLSDVIAQTDVELTRLGWTSTQGRQYLEKTYGKISRTQLTDEELMSFLLYLEDQ